MTFKINCALIGRLSMPLGITQDKFS
jgi:hypothetical protein